MTGRSPHTRAIAVGLALGATFIISPGASDAQTTRRDTIVAVRAARAKQVEPYKPGRLESAFLWAQRRHLAERLFGGADGPYPVFGSITRGAGFAMGAGWRERILHRRVLFNASGAMSVRGYRAGTIEVRFPELAHRHLEVGVRARHRYYPQEDYFGLGPETRKEDRVNYLLSETAFSGFGLYRPVRWLSVAGQVANLSPSIRPGTDTRYPSIETRFDEAGAPGLTYQPNFLETGGAVDADFRDHPNDPRSGSRAGAIVARYHDRDGSRFDFTRLTGVVEHHVPIFDKKRVFSVRLLATKLDPAGGATVPFYYMPALGGRDTIRGLLDYRFRDNAWAVLNAEYRWEAVSNIEMALFYDIGDVKPRLRSLSFADARQSFGVGARFLAGHSIVLRTEAAFGSGEGTRVFAAFGAPLRIERYLR